MAERVWEKFLTEQDKATLTGKADRRIGFGERPALLLIDLYRWVFGDKPEAVTEAIKTWPGVAGSRVGTLCRIFKNCSPRRREVGIPIIHVTGMDGVAVEPWAFRRDTKKRATMAPRSWIVFAAVTTLSIEVKPIPGETVFKKVSPSAFWGTPLVGHLNFPRRRYDHHLRREHQRLCACQRGRRHDQSLAYGGC
jgi:hypothetical protein